MDIVDRADFPGSLARVWFENGAKYGGRVRYSDEDKSIILRVDEKEGVAAAGENATMEVALVDGLYRFPTVYYLQKENGCLFTVPRPDDIRRDQRRSYVRVPVEIPIELFLQGQANPASAKMIDLSGGGACIESDVELKKDDLVEIQFNLRGSQLRIKSKVVRPSSSGGAGLLFYDMKEGYRDRIVGFVFWREIVLRKRKEHIEISE